MMLFAGGIWKNEDKESEFLVRQVVQSARKAIKGKSYIIENENFCVVCGYRRNDSSYNDLNVFNDSDQKLFGFLYGALYKKEITASFSKRTTLCSFELEKITETNGKYLSSNYWGEYVLLYNFSAEKRMYIFPDPMGFSCVYYTKLENCIIFSSDVWCIKDITKEKTALDIDFVKAQINCSMGTIATSVYTPFKNILSVPQGYGFICNTDTLDIELINFWDIFSFSEEKVNINNLGHVFQYCLNSLINGVPEICLELSGGLDSAGLLLTMKHSSIYSGKLSPITYFSSAVAASDEREYAARATEYCDVKLYQQDWKNRPWNLEHTTNKYERLDRPHTKKLSFHLFEELENQFISENHFPVFCSGHGGDHMFCGDTTMHALADYWIDNKFLGLFDNLIKLSKLERKSCTCILQETFDVLYKYYSGKVQHPVCAGLNQARWLKSSDADIETLNKIFNPPFLSKSIGFPPSKFEHIIAVYTGLNQYKIVNKIRRVSIIYPFFSQPFVEFMLAVPVYKMYNANYNRVLLRNALKKMFPDTGNMFFRRSKGGTTAILQMAVEQNEQKIRELCFDGFLARKGEIDKKILEQDISRIKLGSTYELHNLFHLLAVEIWAKEWMI